MMKLQHFWLTYLTIVLGESGFSRPCGAVGMCFALHQNSKFISSKIVVDIPAWMADER